MLLKPASFSSRRLLFLVPLLATMVMAASAAEPQPLTLAEYLRKVWERNENIQIRLLEAAAADSRLKGEKSIFEPEVTAGIEAVDRRRPNTTEQAVSSSFTRVFNERNRTYQGGLETLIPTGARLRLGYTVQHMENSFHAQPPANIFGAPLAPIENGEWLTTAGLTVTQPLLKNGGVRVTFAGIRAAAVQSEIAYQTYRKGLMELFIRAEAAYWDLYQAEEQLGIAGESLRVAQTLLADNKKRLEVGKGTELDVLQAEAGVATRTALEAEARQRMLDAQSRVTTFISQSWTADQTPWKAADSPKLEERPLTFTELWAAVPEMNPDYLGAVKQAELEGVRVVLAKNQALPQLDLKGGYGVSRISSNAGRSVNVLQRQDFPNWTIGLEFRMPWGGGKGRHELRAAQLRAEATAMALDNLGTQLSNGLRAGIESVASYRANQPRYQKVVEANREVLKNQLAQLDAGKTDSRRVLEAEDDLFRARITALENMIRYQRANLDLEFLLGTALKKYGMDFTQAELRERTAILTERAQLTPERYEQFLRDIRAEYDRRVGLPTP